jgi:hypothetical protein
VKLKLLTRPKRRAKAVAKHDKPAKKKGKSSAPARGKSYAAMRRHRPVPWVVWLFAGVLAAVAVTIGLSGLSNRPPATYNAVNGKPVPASLWRQLTSIPPSVWNAVGVQHAVMPELTRTLATKAPTVQYIGGEYCPYCAAERWALSIALSRFGTLTGVKFMHSSTDPNEPYPDTPTMSYYGAHYYSRYITVSLVEMYNRQHEPLEHLTPYQAHLMATYDVPPYVPAEIYSGSIPFVLIGGRYLWIGAGYLPSLLAGHTWPQIVSIIRSGQGPLAQGVLVTANELTAAICVSDGNRPASVCNQPAIKEGESVLPGGLP